MDAPALFVLVGGWPGSGKTTLARALAPRLGLGYLNKDDVKEQLMAAFGEPTDVEASRRLGRTAVDLVLRVAAGLPGAVVDSTWYSYAASAAADLPGRVVELRCVVPLTLARQRYRARDRASGHLDARRSEDELWGSPVAPLGLGPLVEVDTSAPVDLEALVARIHAVDPAP